MLGSWVIFVKAGYIEICAFVKNIRKRKIKKRVCRAVAYLIVQ